MKSLIVQREPELASKIKVIHNWADGLAIQPRQKSQNWFAKEHGIDRVFTVLYSGNLGRCHDLETVMEGAKILNGQAVLFAFIGAGAKLKQCKAFVEKYRLSNCLFLPFQAKEVLPFSLTACDLSLISIDEKVEGLIAPSKFYGCLAAGKAIAAICPPDSYLGNIIDQAQCGRAINNGDADGLADFILESMENPNGAKTMGKNGRKYFEENFTLKQIADQYLELVEASAKKSTSSTSSTNTVVF